MVNDVVSTFAAPETPWGGLKESGLGVTHSDEGLRHLCQTRHVNVDRFAPRREIYWYPYTDKSYRMVGAFIRFLFGKGKKCS